MIRYAEFCTGVGGFRLGIEASGINAKPVYTNEIDDNCEKTYKQNSELFLTQRIFLRLIRLLCLILIERKWELPKRVWQKKSV